jgi:hypothetical protein
MPPSYKDRFKNAAGQKFKTNSLSRAGKTPTQENAIPQSRYILVDLVLFLANVVLFLIDVVLSLVDVVPFCVDVVSLLFDFAVDQVSENDVDNEEDDPGEAMEWAFEGAQGPLRNS